MSDILKIGVIGAGALGGSVAEGLKRSGHEVYVFDKNDVRMNELSSKGIKKAVSPEDLINEADLILVALKPHLMLPVVKSLSDKLSGKLVCSMAAFVEIELLKEAAPGARWARAMTNICSAICKAFTGYYPSGELSSQDVALLKAAFSSIGLAREMTEADLDGVIGVSGSGSAYVFTILEAFIQGGLMSGLRSDISLEAAAMTLIGAAELVLEKGDHPAKLKDTVCTPAGTTIDALRVMEAGGLRTSIIDGVFTACEKGRSGGEALKRSLRGE